MMRSTYFSASFWKGFRYSFWLWLLCSACFLRAELPPPGVIRTLQVSDAETTFLPMPILPSEEDSSQAFDGQHSGSGLILTQWDALLQDWKTATYSPGSGWSGDLILLTPGKPLGLRLAPNTSPLSFSQGGLLPATPILQTLSQGLIHVSSPQLSTQPLTSWNWHLLGTSGLSINDADVLNDPNNLPQAWLQDDQGNISWSGVADPAQPGTLLGNQVYFLEVKGAQAIEVQGQVAGPFNDQVLPSIQAVNINAAQDQVELSIQTAPGTSHTVDLFYQDLSFPQGYDVAAPWKILQLGVVLGAGEQHTVTDAGAGARVHPAAVSARLYQVGDALQDPDGDGLSSAYEELVLKTNPSLADTDGDGIDDPHELASGLDPLTPNTIPTQNLVAEFPLDSDASDLQGKLSATAVGAPQYLAQDGVFGGAIKLQDGAAIQIGDHDAFNTAGPYTERTISLWFTVDHFGFGRQMIYESGGSSRGFNLYVENGVLYAGAWDIEQDSAANDIDTWPGSWQSTQRVQENTWHHVVLRLDASAEPRSLRNNVFSAILDGQAFEQGSTQGMQVYTHGDDAGLGQLTDYSLSHDGQTQGWKALYGALDQVQIWNQALSTDEMKALYGLGLSQGTEIRWDVDSFYSISGGLNGDADGDLWVNALEIGQGTDPLHYNQTLDNATALVEQVWWINSNNTQLHELFEKTSYPFNPQQERLYPPHGERFAVQERFSDKYGRRMFGRFVAPLTGDYQFYLSADRFAELWIHQNGVATKIATSQDNLFEEWLSNPAQLSPPIHLQAGELLKIEAIMVEHQGKDHLSVGVKLPDNRYEMPMRAARFLPVAAGTDFSLDSDGDGLSDYEEMVVGTNALLADSNGDGLSDFDALVHQLDPQLSLLQLPEIPAAWILQHDIYTTNPYIYADPDADLLTNVEEFFAGTDPNLADSSGDGVSDAQVVKSFQLDATQAWFDGTRSELDTAAASEAQVLTGSWIEHADGTLVAQSSGGSVSYPLTVPADGFYVVEIEVEQQNPLSSMGRFQIEAQFGAVLGSTLDLFAPVGQPAEALFLTPKLQAGLVQVRFTWRNTNVNSRLGIRNVRLIELGGPDADQNGSLDWQDELEGSSLLVAAPASSFVSPVCIEGESAYRDGLSLSSTALPAVSLAAGPGIQQNWYADVPLLPSALTQVDIENSFTGAQSTLNIEWTPTNLFPQAVDPIVIRQHDSLLLSGTPAGASAGTVTIEVVGVSTYSGSVQDEHAHLFDQAGTFTVNCSWEDQGNLLQTQSTVKVVGGGFPLEKLSLQANFTKEWTLHELPEEAVLEVDEGVSLEELPPMQDPRVINLRLLQPLPRTLVARLGEEGPVLDHVVLQSFNPKPTWRYEVVSTYPDGSQLVEATMIFDHIPENMRIKIETRTSGLLFENGTRILELTEADIGEDGRLIYRIFQTPDSKDVICHRMWFYDTQTGIRLGNR